MLVPHCASPQGGREREKGKGEKVKNGWFSSGGRCEYNQAREPSPEERRTPWPRPSRALQTCAPVQRCSDRGARAAACPDSKAL